LSAYQAKQDDSLIFRILPGRIKKKLLKAQLSLLDSNTNGSEELVCPLCNRVIPPSQRDAHHLTPKSRGGRETVVLHRICHRQIHALFTETELARQLNTVDLLQTHEQMRPFVKWIRTKRDDFFEKTRKSHRLKSKS
jgi:hypothetical protein